MPDHAFTFVVVDHAMKQHRAEAPYYGLDAYEGTECGGNNLHDLTPFTNLVPYDKGQVAGSRHTWAHILEKWSFERRLYRWEVRPDRLE